MYIVCKIIGAKVSSQTKDKLVSSEVRQPVEDVIGKYFEEYLNENPKEAKQIILKLLTQLEREKRLEKRRKLLDEKVF